jgi:hypothetical protein
MSTGEMTITVQRKTIFRPSFPDSVIQVPRAILPAALIKLSLIDNLFD